MAASPNSGMYAPFIARYRQLLTSLVKNFPHVLALGLTSACLALASSLAVLPAQGDPLDHWTMVPSGVTNGLRAIAYGSNQFVAVGSTGVILISSNALAWNAAASGVTTTLYGVTYGLGKFLAVGSSGVILTSTNGTQWVSQTPKTPNDLLSVTYCPLGFFIGGRYGTLLSSTNGTNWTFCPTGASESGGFVGVGYGLNQVYAGENANAPALFWSTNGSTWFYETNVPVNDQPQNFNGNFAGGNGRVVTLSYRDRFYVTPDGFNWTMTGIPTPTPPGFDYCFGLTFARNQFVAVGGNFNSPGRGVATSTNGINWMIRYNKSLEGRLLGVAYGSYRFVAVGDGGGILVSDPMLWLSNPSSEAGLPHATLNGEVGTTYQIQTATNVAQPVWVNLGAVTNASETQDILLPLQGASPTSFYRVSTP